MIWQFEHLWQGKRWLENAIIETDQNGNIVSLFDKTEEQVNEIVSGWSVPGFVNSHSHSFQFTMAGMAEYMPKGQSEDDFWSWRERMYSLALSLSPETFQTVAEMLYAEMLRQGYTWVAEFHYLHHDQNGRHYPHVAEMGERLLQAAESTGIGITLIPIFYQQGGFGQDPEQRQRRFICNNADAYMELWNESALALSGRRQKIALGVHSLRAVQPESLWELISIAPKDYAWHIHIAEQVKEVQECEAVLGARPVQWLMENADIDDKWNLVHATHANSGEVEQIIQRQANVVLCPSTEANLGDGLFPLAQFWQQKGSWSIGSDSQVSLSPLEELRWLDYGQRLNSKRRNILCSREGEDSGEVSIQQSLSGGRRAIGMSESCDLRVGDPLDLVVVDSKTPLWQKSEAHRLLSLLIYSTDAGQFKGTITSGQWRVKEGRHVNIDNIAAKWQAARLNY